MRRLIGQFARFGVVGLVGFVIDFAVFNLLRATVFSPEEIHEGPVYAKIVSTSIAILANWIGNRYWTFREHRGRQLFREGIEFAIVSLGGMVIGLFCLWVSHYVLGFTSVLADNISSNVIGLALGTLFRFTFYRLWVFAPHRGEPAPALFPDVDVPASVEPSAAERMVRPAGSAPGIGVQAVAPVDDRR
jgi:putative flippase GtrA